MNRRDLKLIILIVATGFWIFFSGCAGKKTDLVTPQPPIVGPDVKPLPSTIDPFAPADMEMTHEVKKGESFRQIVEDYYGTQKKAVRCPPVNGNVYNDISKAVAKSNGLKDMSQIFPGQILKLPIVSLEENQEIRPFKYPFEANFEKAKRFLEDEDFKSALKRFQAAKRLKPDCQECDQYIADCQRQIPQPIPAIKGKKVSPIDCVMKSPYLYPVEVDHTENCKQWSANDCKNKALKNAKWKAIHQAKGGLCGKIEKCLEDNDLKTDTDEIMNALNVNEEDEHDIEINYGDWSDDLSTYKIKITAKIQVRIGPEIYQRLNR